MLFFIDETWQTVGGHEVGALAAVSFPRERYNGFCREVWRIKETVLGAKQLDQAELHGTDNFAKAAFTKRRESGQSKLLQAVDETFAALSRHGGHAYAAWTTHPEWLLLRNPVPEKLSPVYSDLLHDFKRRLEQGQGPKSRGLLFFDNRGTKEDRNAACAIQNFVARVGEPWPSLFIQTPHFTPSVVSPGIQVADLIAYLSAHRNDPTVRPELAPYWTRVRAMAFVHKGRRALRPINTARGKGKGPAEAKPRKRPEEGRTDPSETEG
jgi:hypothetical protein